MLDMTFSESVGPSPSIDLACNQKSGQLARAAPTKDQLLLMECPYILLTPLTSLPSSCFGNPATHLLKFCSQWQICKLFCFDGLFWWPSLMKCSGFRDVLI